MKLFTKRGEDFLGMIIFLCGIWLWVAQINIRYWVFACLVGLYFKIDSLNWPSEQ